jgi:hypothetical protein
MRFVSLFERRSKYQQAVDEQFSARLCMQDVMRDTGACVKNTRAANMCVRALHFCASFCWLEGERRGCWSRRHKVNGSLLPSPPQRFSLATATDCVRENLEERLRSVQIFQECENTDRALSRSSH